MDRGRIPGTGIICLADENHQYQVVADGTYITLGNGVRYDFGDQIISDAQGNSRMTFQEMLLNADDNIQVQSAEDWVAPEFKFDVIDGQSGEEGAAGETGAAWGDRCRLVSRVTKEKKERSETTAKTEKTVKMETKARTAMKEAAEMMAPMAEAVPTVRAVPTDPVEKRVRTEA